MQDTAPGSIRFGPFVLDLRSGDLHGDGGIHRLAVQPLALLTALLERSGEMVSREELRARLWPDGTFVDFEHGLNSAVNRLREALGDSASAPRFVETIPRRGYRLLLRVEGREGAAAGRSLPGRWANRRRPTGLVAAILVAAGVGGGLLLNHSGRLAAPLLASVVIDLPGGWLMLNQSPAISPDSRQIVFSALHRDGRRAVWLRSLGAGAARMLPNTVDGDQPFWSPSGSEIAFFAAGKLRVMPLDGGSARVVSGAPPDSSGAWGQSDVLLFAPGVGGAVMAIEAMGGAARPVTELDRSAGDLRHARPHWLPDGRHFVYLAERADERVAMLAALGNTRARPLGTVQSHVQPTPSGHVLFVHNGRLLAQRIDVARGRLVGDASSLAEGLIRPGRNFLGRFSASRDLLVYLRPARRECQLSLFDRSGKPVASVGEPGDYSGPSLSPDGTRLAVARSEATSAGRDIWVFDLADGKRSRLTSDPGDDLAPRWSADGKWLLFSSDRRGERDIYRRLASGEGDDELVYESGVSKSVNAWSADGRFVAYDTGGLGGTSQLHVLPLAGDRRPRVLAAGAGFRQQADISPDGRLIAYASTESGRWEVIVQTFPEMDGGWRITTDGGREPLWRGDGREIFFRRDESIMAADIRRDGGALKWSAPRVLFGVGQLQQAPRTFSVSRDGQLLVALTATAHHETERLSALLNWTSLLK